MSNQEMWEKMEALLDKKLQALHLHPDQNPGSGKTEKKAHNHFSQEDDFCPDCYPSIKQKVLEKEIMSRKDNPLVCVNCGTRTTEEEESCPTCGGTEAEYRD